MTAESSLVSLILCHHVARTEGSDLIKDFAHNGDETNVTALQ